MRRVSLFFSGAQPNNNAWRTPIFDTLTNASFDAQDIVSELLSSPKAYHGAPANQLHPDAS
jgi:hypothetical protein